MSMYERLEIETERLAETIKVYNYNLYINLVDCICVQTVYE